MCRYHDGDAYIIDVSQSVEHDHPHALEFLRKDCSNINGENPPTLVLRPQSETRECV